MASEFSSIASMADFMRFHAIHGPERIALDFEGRQTSFRQLEEASNQVANGLRGETRPSARVAILDKNSNWYVEVLVGALKAETVVVPINSRLAPPEIAFILNDSRSEVLFVGENFLETIATIRDQIGSVRRIVVLDREYEEWRDAQSEEQAGKHALPSRQWTRSADRRRQSLSADHGGAAEKARRGYDRELRLAVSQDVGRRRR